MICPRCAEEFDAPVLSLVGFHYYYCAPDLFAALPSSVKDIVEGPVRAKVRNLDENGR